MREDGRETIGAGRAYASVVVGTLTALLGVCWAVYWHDTLHYVIGAIWVLGFGVNTRRALRARIVLDADGITALSSKYLSRRVHVHWADVARVEASGDGTVTRPAQVVIATVDGDRIRVGQFGIDLDAAEQAVARIDRYRQAHATPADSD